MKNKIKILLVTGYLFIVVLFILRQQQSGNVSFMGHTAFKLGNKTVKIKTPPNAKYITDQDSIMTIIGIEDLAFLITGDSIYYQHGDSTINQQTVIFADYLTMDEIDTFEELIQALDRDTSMIAISRNISGDILTLIRKTNETLPEKENYLISKFYNCYPYYLRIRSVWKGSEDIPDQIEILLNTIDVSK